MEDNAHSNIGMTYEAKKAISVLLILLFLFGKSGITYVLNLSQFQLGVLFLLFLLLIIILMPKVKYFLKNIKSFIVDIFTIVIFSFLLPLRYVMSHSNEFITINLSLQDGVDKVITGITDMWYIYPLFLFCVFFPLTLILLQIPSEVLPQRAGNDE